MRFKISIISPLIILPIYFANIDISLPEVTLDIIGCVGLPNYNAVSYNLLINFLLFE